MAPSSNSIKFTPGWLLALVLLTGLTGSGCGLFTSSAGNAPAPEKKIQTALQKVELEVCTACKNMDDVHRYEDRLQSTRLDVPLLDLAKAFLGRDYYMDRKSSYFKSEMGFIFDLSLAFHEYESYARPGKGDSLPHLVVLYTFSKQIPKEKANLPLPLYQTVGKFFFDDPVLSRYLPDSSRSTWVPDTNYVWGLFDTLVQRGLSCFPPGEGALDYPVKNSYFFKERSFQGPEYKFQAHKDFWGTYVGEAPYENHYISQFISCKPDEETGEYPPDSCMTLGFHLGWASSKERYLRTDSTAEGIRHSFQIEAKDIAIYFSLWWADYN